MVTKKDGNLRSRFVEMDERFMNVNKEYLNIESNNSWSR
jgi:hypothetical protein